MDEHMAVRISRGDFSIQGLRVVWKIGRHILWVEPYGQDAIRVRATVCSSMPEKDWAVIPQKEADAAHAYLKNGSATIINGRIKACVNEYGKVSFYNVKDDIILCSEKEIHWSGQHPRSFKYRTDKLFYSELSMQSFRDEKLYGFGQHKNGHLNQKNCVIDLEQKNSEVNIPFTISNRGYGFIWHNPGVGRVELAKNHTRWIANATSLIDYIVIAGESPHDILELYAGITGMPPMFPDWAAGFWQCKLRYKTQKELLDTAREYKKRDIPLSVIVVDFFHWPHMGDYEFDHKYWPDPACMVKELEKMGIKLMVSVWPTINMNSKNYKHFSDKGLLIHTKNGHNLIDIIEDGIGDEKVAISAIDTTNPATQKSLWSLIKKNYYDHGIKMWWLDAIEPQIGLFRPFENLVFDAGDGEEVAMLYPLYQQKTFYEGLSSKGEKEIINLCRSGFLGSQKYGAAIWSGDIKSTFESLQEQVRAGLNMALSGIPWWTTDIGGFEGGNIDSEYFRELVVRWFQYGMFCPIFRLHGYRLDNNKFKAYPPDPKEGGADNEVWSFGEKSYRIIRECIYLRERLRPYIMEQMEITHKKGIPIMRPLFFDFCQDKKAYDIEDEFMFGPDILVAPVLEQGASERIVYLPESAKWMDPYENIIHNGGQSILSQAPLDRIPVFLRNGCDILIVEK